MQIVALREIRSAARRPATYWSRLFAGAVGGIVLFSMFIQFTIGRPSGREPFFACIFLTFVLFLLEGVRQASTSIVEERADGTLGLILLTPMRGAELLLGKFLSLLFFTLQILLTVVPVIGMCLLFGGVGLGEIARATLGIAHTAILAIAIGLVISARSVESSRAMTGTFFLLFGGAIVLSLGVWPTSGWPGFIFNSLNPMTPLWKIDEVQYNHFTKEYWISIAISWTLAALALRLASVRLTTHFAFGIDPVKTPPAPPTPKVEAQSPAQPVAAPTAEIAPEPSRELSLSEQTEIQSRRSKRWFSGNPIEWLTLRHLGMHGRTAMPYVLGFVGAFMMIFPGRFGVLIAVIVFLIFGFLYSAGASRTLARAKQMGELELWLTTPLTINDIIKGQIGALRTTFVIPGLIMFFAALTSIFIHMLLPIVKSFAAVQGSVTVGGQSTMEWNFVYIFVSTIAAILSLIFVLPYVAMWIALKAKTPAQAAVRTFLWMFVAPWIILGIPKALIFLPLGAVASHSVRNHLKYFATGGKRQVGKAPSKRPAASPSINT